MPQFNTTTITNKLTVPSDDGSRNIGYIEDGCFHKYNFNANKHICYKHKAIGLDIGAFKNCIQPHAYQINCTDIVTGRAYSISTEEFQLHAIVDDLGSGPQMFVKLDYWTVSAPEQQLSFWEALPNA